MKRALITGITGQDGSYLAELLLAKDYDVLIEIDPRYFRPTEVEYLLGDATKAKKKLGWKAKVSFGELVRMMVDADLKELEELKRCQLFPCSQ